VPVIESEMRVHKKVFAILALEHLDDESLGPGTSLISLLRERGFEAERMDGGCIIPFSARK